MSDNPCIVFAGELCRGNRFDKAVRKHGWRIHIAAGPRQATALCSEVAPDLVIIDDFPESEAARSLFYELRIQGKGPFLLLNDSPGQMRFAGLGALSFLKMIKRDPDPADLINAVSQLIDESFKSGSRKVAKNAENNTGGQDLGCLARANSKLG